MVIPIVFIVVGLVFIGFNQKLVAVEAKIKSRKWKNVDERLLKTQIYVAGGIFLLGGLAISAMNYK